MIEEKIVIGKGGEYPLNGILTLPDEAEGPAAAVVMVHGSGSSNMDEKIGGCTPFKDLAAGLAERGIASVRYDKRSFAHGRKMLRSGLITVKEETIDDAVLAAELLRSDPRIDSDRIFVLGHSMGAMLAPRIDAEGGDFCGIIMMAGTLRRLEEVMLSQNQAVLESTKGLVRMIVKKQVSKLEKMFAGLDGMTDEEAMSKKVGGGTTLYYFKEMAKKPAADYLRESQKPMLIMQGARDFQVSLEKDFSLYKELLGGRANAEFRVYENLNHAFVQAVSDDIMKAKQEYAAERHIGPQVIDDIADWIKGV